VLDGPDLFNGVAGCVDQGYVQAGFASRWHFVVAEQIASSLIDHLAQSLPATGCLLAALGNDSARWSCLGHWLFRPHCLYGDVTSERFISDVTGKKKREVVSAGLRPKLLSGRSTNAGELHDAVVEKLRTSFCNSLITYQNPPPSPRPQATAIISAKGKIIADIRAIKSRSS